MNTEELARLEIIEDLIKNGPADLTELSDDDIQPGALARRTLRDLLLAPLRECGLFRESPNHWPSVKK